MLYWFILLVYRLLQADALRVVGLAVPNDDELAVLDEFTGDQ